MLYQLMLLTSTAEIGAVMKVRLHPLEWQQPASICADASAQLRVFIRHATVTSVADGTLGWS